MLANPPFSLKQWGHEEWESDRWGRNQYGTPPESNGDLAWVQHMIKSMKQKNGRLAVVLPLGTLFRASSEGVIRKNLIEADLIETVIELASNLFYGATIPACILVLKKQKSPLAIGKIRFIDGSKQFRKGRNQNTFEIQHILHVLDIYANFNDVGGESVTVTNTQVLDVDGNLSINRWVKAENTRVIASISDSTINLKESLSILAAAEVSMNKIFAQYGISK